MHRSSVDSFDDVAPPQTCPIGRHGRIHRAHFGARDFSSALTECNKWDNDGKGQQQVHRRPRSIDENPDEWALVVQAAANVVWIRLFDGLLPQHANVASKRNPSESVLCFSSMKAD